MNETDMNATGDTIRRRLAWGGIALAVVLFFAVNIFSDTVFRAAKLDLTEADIYTLSDSTREVLAAIEEPITIRLYYSPILGERSPSAATHHRRVKAMLEQYADLADGKIRLEFHDPEPFSETEDRAVAFGLQGVPVTDAGDLGYFGLAATNSTDDSEVVPFFNEERAEFLEYDLTKIVHTLANPDKPVVGILSTVPLSGRQGQGGGFSFVQQMADFFGIRQLTPQDTGIPDEVYILMVIHPHDLTDRMLYAIDQFVLRGGRVLAFVDPHAEIDILASRQQMVEPGASDFNRLLNAWHLNLAEGEIAGDLGAARRVSFQGEDGKLTTADYVAWLELGPANMDAGDVVTGRIDRINMATAGILETVEGEGNGVRVQPLITTGPKSMRLDAGDFGFRPKVLELFSEFEPSGVRLTLAARVTGDVRTAFPDGPPAAGDAGEGEETGDDGEDAEPLPEHLDAAREPANIIVVADADMLHDQFWLQRQDFLGQQIEIPQAGNADLVYNALDNLSGSPALITLRGRGTTERPFELVQEIRQEAEQRYRAKEQELRAKLQDVRDRMSKLASRTDAEGAVIVSEEEQAKLDEYRAEMLDIRGQLRAVQHDLRKDIERLDGWLKFLNIGAVPLLLGAAALGAAALRRRRRRIRIRQA